MDLKAKPDDVSSEDLALIVKHLGYEPIVDTCGGYTVERIVLNKWFAGEMLFNPYRFHAQALALEVYLRTHLGLDLDHVMVQYMTAEDYVDKIVRKAIEHFKHVDTWKILEKKMRTKKENTP